MLLAIVFVIISGVVGAIIPPCNACLARFLISPSSVPIVVCVTGLACALLIALPSFSGFKEVYGIPWWAWLGGPLGIVVIFATLFSLPKIGAGAASAIGIAATLITSIIIDHYGWMEMTPHPITFPRIVGMVMLLLGSFLII